MSANEPSETDRCPNCGTEIKVGDWPYCPHGRGAYGFSMGNPIRKWEKMTNTWGEGTNGGKVR